MRWEMVQFERMEKMKEEFGDRSWRVWESVFEWKSVKKYKI